MMTTTMEITPNRALLSIACCAILTAALLAGCSSGRSTGAAEISAPRVEGAFVRLVEPHTFNLTVPRAELSLTLQPGPTAVFARFTDRSVTPEDEAEIYIVRGIGSGTRLGIPRSVAVLTDSPGSLPFDDARRQALVYDVTAALDSARTAAYCTTRGSRDTMLRAGVLERYRTYYVVRALQRNGVSVASYDAIEREIGPRTPPNSAALDRACSGQ